MRIWRIAALALLGLALLVGPALAEVGEDGMYARDPNTIDLDLTGMNATMVYAQVAQMTMTPEAYEGAVVKMRGSMYYFKNEETGSEYFTCIVADATACCEQGIEFVRKGDYHYPEDYPPLNTMVTVVGTFNSYMENGYRYIQLKDADVTWDGMT